MNPQYTGYGIEGVAMTRLPLRIATIFTLLVVPITAVVAQTPASPPDGFALPAGAIHRFGNRQLRHADGISGTAISPDGKFIATMGSSSIIVWDLKSLAAKCILRDVTPANIAGDPANNRMSFLSDSKSLLVSVRPSQYYGGKTPDQRMESARVFDIETGKVRFTLAGDQDYWSSAWVVGDGKEIALYTRRNLRYFSAADGKELRTVSLGQPQFRSLPYVAPTGNRIALRAARDNSSLFVLDAATGKEHNSVSGAGILVQAALSPDGKVLVCHYDSGKVHVHDLDEKKEIQTFDHPAEKQLGPMRFSADRRTLYFGGQHGQLFRWDLKNNKQLPDVGRHSTWTLSSIVLTPDESMLYSTGYDKVIRRWDLKTGKQLPLPDGYMTQTAVVPTPDGKHLIVADHEGRVDYWDLTTGKLANVLQPGKTGGIDCVAVSADGRWLAGGRTLQDVKLVDLRTGKEERIIPLVEKPDPKGGDHVKRVAFSPDGKVLLTGSQQTGVTAWEVPSGKKLWNAMVGHLLAFDPKGRWVVAGGGFADPPIRFAVLDAKTGEVIRRLEVMGSDENPDAMAYGYPPYLSDLTFTPDGSRLITTHYDGTIRSWDLDAAKQLSMFRAANVGQGGLSVSVSPDGRLIGLGRPDKKIGIWELASGKEVLSLGGHDSAVRDVAFTRDSRGIVGNADLAPVLWSLTPANLPKLDGNAETPWDGLALPDGAKAYLYVWALARDSKVAIKLFGEKINPAELIVDKARFEKWLADLDSSQFRIRETAERELTKAGSKLPIAGLRQALAESKSDEARARLTRVLTNREKPDPNEWRLTRAVQALELAGTDDAKALLKTWAAGEGSALAADAAGALKRLEKP